MNAFRAKSTAASIIEVSKLSDETEKGAVPSSLVYGVIYVLLSMDTEDGLGALIAMQNDYPAISYFWISTLKKIVTWSDDECRKAIAGFPKVVSPQPIITTIEELRQRNNAMQELMAIVLMDHAKLREYAKLLEAPN